MNNAFSRTTGRRGAKAPANSHGKLAVVGVLVVALGGVLVFNHYSGLRPAGAAVEVGGTNVGGGATTAMPPEGGISDVVLANLAEGGGQEPVRLVGDSRDIEAPPANPFALSNAWRAQLVKPEPAKPMFTTAIEAPAAVPVKVPHVNLDAIKVQGVVRDATQAYAIINGILARPGTVVAGLRVVEVAEDHVGFCPVGAGESARFDYPLKPKSK